MENAQVNNEMPMSKTIGRIPRPTSYVIVELAIERRDVSDNLAKLKKAIEANPEGVSEYHKGLWRRQANAMQEYKEVLGVRISDLIAHDK